MFMNSEIKQFKSLVEEEKLNVEKGLKRIGYNLNGEIKY